MARYVIGPDVAIRLAHDEAVIRDEHQILAPTLLRSQMLPLLYQAVRRGEMTRKDAGRQLDYVRGLRIRLLGDRVLQNVAWSIRAMHDVVAHLCGLPDVLAGRLTRIAARVSAAACAPERAFRGPVPARAHRSQHVVS